MIGMSEKQTFLMYKSWAAMLIDLPEAQTSAVIKGICRYQLGYDLSVDDPVASAILAMIIPQMELDDKKYADEIRKRSEAGKKGMRKRWEAGRADASDNGVITNDNTVITDDNTSITNVTPLSPAITKITDYVSVSDSVSDSVSEKDKRSKDKTLRELSLPTDPSGLPGEKERDGRAVSHPARKKPEDVRHRKGEYGHVMLTDKQLADLIRKHGEPETAAAIEAVDAYCEESGKTYHNYALVVERWGYDAARRGKNRKDGPPARDEPMSGNEFLLSMIREGGDGHADHD